MMQRIELRPWIPLLMGGASGLGYAVAYVHERGYCDFYHIPSDFIRLDLTTILLAVAASLAGLAMVAWFFSLLLTIPSYTSDTRRKIYYSLAVLLLYFVYAFRYLTTGEAKALGITLLVVLVFLFVGPSLLRRLPRRRQRQDIPLARLAKNKYFQYTVIIICIVSVILSFGYLEGTLNAWQKEVFYVPSSNPDLVVLKIYGDNMICKKLVQESDKVGLGPTIILLRMEDISNVTLTPIETEISFVLIPK